MPVSALAQEAFFEGILLQCLVIQSLGRISSPLPREPPSILVDYLQGTGLVTKIEL